MTFEDLLAALDSQHNFMVNLLNNLAAYCDAAKQRVEADPTLLQLERAKMFLVSKQDSHQDEVENRLSFLEFYATNTEIKI